MTKPAHRPASTYALYGLFSVSGLCVLAWPFVMIVSVFLFDSEPTARTWITAWMLWTYPAIWGASLAIAITMVRRKVRAWIPTTIAPLPYVPILGVVTWHA